MSGEGIAPCRWPSQDNIKVREIARTAEDEMDIIRERGARCSCPLHVVERVVMRGGACGGGGCPYGGDC